MTRTQRLVLDALEDHQMRTGDPWATVIDHIVPYVSARKWFFLHPAGAIYVALYVLEHHQRNVISKQLPLESGARYRRRAYATVYQA